MKIDRDEAKRIADLAHLEFDEPALERMAGEMTKILSYIDQLREVDVDRIRVDARPRLDADARRRAAAARRSRGRRRERAGVQRRRPLHRPEGDR